MGKEKISPKSKTTKKATGSGVWEIKSKSENYGERDEQKPRRSSYSDKSEKASQERPRRRSTSSEQENSYEKRESKPRRSYSDRPERTSQERSRRRSASAEQRETSYERREQKPRRSYSDRPERTSQERPRRRSASAEQRETSYERREQKSRKSYSDRPERTSQERPRRRSASAEQRETSYERREQKPRRSYSDRPERDSRERPRKYSSDSALHTRRSAAVSDTDRIRTKQAKKKDELVRLNKFIANSGICSRREADEYIVAGLVSVNGQVITELGTKVKKDDDVRFNKERLKGENKAYLLLNKPKDYITTTDDPHAKKTVMELIDGACKERVYPVGRLDRNSTGVLLFTNDGDLAKQLTHPSYNKLKVYQVRLDRNIAKADVKALVEGIELEDGQAIADSVHVSETNKAEVGIEIHSGRNRIIRRMFEKLGYNVVKLDRVYFAGLTKKGLRRGQYRLLSSKEIEMLKMGAYE